MFEATSGTWRSMGSDQMHQTVMREVADEVAKPLSLILWSCGSLVKFTLTGKGETYLTFSHFWKGEKTKTRELQAAQSHLGAQQDHGVDPPRNYAKAHGKQGEVGDKKHGFTKPKSSPTNLVAFYDKVTAMVGREEQMPSIFDMWKAFDALLHDTLVSKVETHGFDRWTTQKIRIWLDDCTQTVTVNSSVSK